MTALNEEYMTFGIGRHAWYVMLYLYFQMVGCDEVSLK
jgi:hypothetical protein